MAVIDGKIILTKNDCYKEYQKMTPAGIVVHSTGANNPYIKRYVQPDDGVIGKNIYNNDWNRSGLYVCVHAFIGYDKNDVVRCYQTLPFDICCWGVGSGWNGSYNFNPAYIQFEMCEDDLSDKSYCKKVYDKAVTFCVWLCRKYGISPDNIVSHKEAYDKGFGSGHVDPTNWWGKFGYTMDGFRAAVKSRLNGVNVKTKRRCRLYKAAYKDPVGDSVAYAKIKKNTVLKWLEDDMYGWSKVSYKNKTFYIINSNLNKKGLSGLVSYSFIKDTSAYLVKGNKLTKTTIKKGTTVQVICWIEAGKYKGYEYVKSGGKYYYLIRNS